MKNGKQRLEFTVRSREEQDGLEKAIGAGTIVVDTARRRPFYFDGRFLTAADLSADQDYVRARQSDLAQAMGAGVVRGLMVSIRAGSTAASPVLEIDAGVGITPAGDVVSIDAPKAIDLAAIADEAQLDLQLGVKLLPTAAAINRTGLYVLALRPIEFTANPVPSYPTTLDGARSVHDGDIFEATAITLIPYPDRAGSQGADAKRARVAREIFFDGFRPGVLQQALPLAMLYVENGALRWLDVYLVRREIGAESTLAAGLAQRPRALLEAWLHQHVDHYGGLPPEAVQGGFPATRFFEALPPVGWIPAASLSVDPADNAGTVVQSFFPPLVDCELAFVPDDEIPALVAEALALPPIDLQGSDDDLDRLSILIVAGVSRLDLERLKRRLQTVTRSVRSAAPGMLAKRLPLDSLLRIAQPVRPVPAPEESSIAAAWKDALAVAQNAAQQTNRRCFWYLRRRQLPYYAEISSATLRLAGNAEDLDAAVALRLEQDGTTAVVSGAVAKMSSLAAADTVNLLAAPRFALSPRVAEGVLKTSDLLRRSVVESLRQAATAATVSHEQVLALARRFGDPELGEGFDRLALAAPDLETSAAVTTIAASGVAPELDAAARKLPSAEQSELAARLASLALAADVEGVQKLVGAATGAPP